MAPFRRSSRKRLDALADEDLMSLVRDGDTDAFGVVYDRHSTVAFSLAYRMVGRRGAAETVVQEAFLSLWRAAGRYDAGRGSLRTFLLGIVHNRAVDALRRASVHDSRRVDDEEAAERLEAKERTEAEAARREEASRVRGAVADLPSEQKKVIELAYFGGFSQSEIAEMLGAPLGTVKGRMRLGLEKLRSALGEGSVEAWT
jgi:RNA polymerase sigma-70 factor (ECF subfamily)